MSKRIIGDVDVKGSATTSSKYLAQGVLGDPFDSAGNLEMDAYTRDEITDIINVLPVSHYGTYNFLPAGINGSFEGASEVPSYRYRRIHVEDDGTLTILRPGTNGAKRGLYYSYLNNILSTTNLNLAVNTNREYKPGYFGSTYTAKMCFASDNKVVSGIAFNSNNDEYFFISWSNGTLNDTQHVGSIVPMETLLPNEGTVRFVMTGNSQIYIFVEVSQGGNLAIEVRSVPITQIKASATTLTVTEYKNWTTNGFYSRTISNPDIILNEKKFSTNISDMPYMLIPSTTTSTEPYMGGADIYATQNANGIVRVRVVGDAWCTTINRNIRPKHSYSFLLNFNTKVATLEAGNVAPLTITDPGSGTALNVSGSTFTTDPITTNNGNRGNLIMAYFYFDNGTTIGIGSENLGSAPTRIFRAVYPNVTSVYDTLQVRSHTSTNFITGNMNTSFGSPVGSEVMSFEWLPNNRYRVSSYDANSRYRNSLNEYKPGATYTFGSVSYGTLKGFEPTSNRKFIDDTWDNRILISSITGSTVKTNGGVFIENTKLSTPLTYDQDMNKIGTISISNSLLTNLKNQQLSNAAYSVDTGNASNITLYVPQQSDCPAFALISACTPALTNYYKVIEVNVNTRSGTISSLSFKRLVTEGTGTFGALKENASYGPVGTSTGITIYDAGSFYFIGGVDPYMYGTQGDSNSITWRAKVTKSTQQMDDFTVMSTYQAHTGGGQLPWAVPGVGFGYLDPTAQAGDDRVRIIFQPVGTTLAQYNAWADSGSKLVLASQDVAQGFIIYFTEETPVILSGKSFTMSVTNIDLTTIKSNPANTTFQVYVQMVEGLARYKITEEVIAETGTSAYNLLWIGTITTNSLQISSINIQKRSRLDVFGPSVQPAGSSFPVSSGLPSGNGSIQW